MSLCYISRFEFDKTLRYAENVLKFALHKCITFYTDIVHYILFVPINSSLYQSLQIVLTKCDLLPPTELQQCIQVVGMDIRDLLSKKDLAHLRNGHRSKEAKEQFISEMQKSLVGDEEGDGDGNDVRGGTDGEEEEKEDEDEDEDAGMKTNDEDQSEEAEEKNWRILSSTIDAMIIPVSASTGAGVGHLYKDLKACVKKTVNTKRHSVNASQMASHVSIGDDPDRFLGDEVEGGGDESEGRGGGAVPLPHVVREHPLADLLRKQSMLGKVEVKSESSNASSTRSSIQMNRIKKFTRKMK